VTAIQPYGDVVAQRRGAPVGRWVRQGTTIVVIDPQFERAPEPEWGFELEAKRKRRDARTLARARLRYQEGAALRPQPLTRQQVDDARQAVIARPKVSSMDVSQVKSDHRGAESHFALNDPNAMSVVVKTVNEPQAVLISGKGNWVFWRAGTVVVTRPGRPQVMLTAYGRGARIPPRWIKAIQANNPDARVGDPERPVSLKQLRGGEALPGFRRIRSALLWP
jgi:hypothetical protein